MLIHLSNHPLSNQERELLTARYGAVMEMPLPSVSLDLPLCEYEEGGENGGVFAIAWACNVQCYEALRRASRGNNHRAGLAVSADIDHVFLAELIRIWYMDEGDLLTLYGGRMRDLKRPHDVRDVVKYYPAMAGYVVVPDIYGSDLPPLDEGESLPAINGRIVKAYSTEEDAWYSFNGVMVNLHRSERKWVEEGRVPCPHCRCSTWQHNADGKCASCEAVCGTIFHGVVSS